MPSVIMLSVVRPLTGRAFIFCSKTIFQTNSFQQIILILDNYKVPRHPSLSTSLFLTLSLSPSLSLSLALWQAKRERELHQGTHSQVESAGVL